MYIQLNGKPESVGLETTIGDLIREKGLDPKTVVVEHNRDIIDAKQWYEMVLKENDTLEVLRFVGGG